MFSWILVSSYSIPFQYFLSLFYNLFCVVRSCLDDKLLGGIGMMHDGTTDRSGETILSNAPDAVNYFPNQIPRDIAHQTPLRRVAN